MKISVLIKDPGRKPRHVWIQNSLNSLQKTVGGYIETVTLANDCVVICNEEGRLMGMPHNCTICGIDFVGTIVIAGIDGDEFSDMPVCWAAAKKLFRTLWQEPLQELEEQR